MGIKDNNLLLKLMTNGFNRSHLIRIARYHKKSVSLILRGIKHQRYRKINVRSLFFKFDEG